MVTLQEQIQGAVKSLRLAGLNKSCVELVLRAFAQDPELNALTLEELGQKALDKRLNGRSSIGDLHDEIKSITDEPWMALAILERGREHVDSVDVVRALNG